MKLRTYLFLSGFVLAAACKNEQAVAPASVDGKFDCNVALVTTSYVYNVVTANCTSRGCHRAGGSDFSTADKLKSYISASRAVFTQRVTSAQATMPPSRFPALSQGTKDSIACWIEKGMPDK
ncbi:hypothetical protein [Chitinophaga flava]|uniref:hypothetical protein n=1 Tax=Chitinophaga flava TaxID=2259036 RepID=UPI000DE3AD5E|nr:hypothetical protein [Chitinophaga flava]